jgi:hypothetical protein
MSERKSAADVAVSNFGLIKLTSPVIVSVAPAGRQYDAASLAVKKRAPGVTGLCGSQA